MIGIDEDEFSDALICELLSQLLTDEAEQIVGPVLLRIGPPVHDRGAEPAALAACPRGGRPRGKVQ